MLLVEDDSDTALVLVSQGPEGASEKMFVNIATKSFKRRFCKLRQDVAGSYFLDICKEEKKQEASTSIALDECSEILRFAAVQTWGFLRCLLRFSLIWQK